MAVSAGKVRAALIVAILESSIFGAAAQEVAGDHLIVPGVRIGAAEIAPADQGALTRNLGQPERTDRNGDHEIYHYGSPEQLAVDFDIANDAPFEISTASPAYRTKDGLGVGSSAAAIRARLGQPLCQGGGDAGIGVLAYDSVWFLLTRGAAVRVSIRAHVKPGELSAGSIACQPAN